MKEPPDRPGPDFNQARSELEAWRQQQIAALTPEQRKQYETVRDEHKHKMDAKSAELRVNARQRTIEIAKELLTSKPAPTLQPGKNAPNAHHLKRLRDAVPDYYDGKKTRETKVLGHELRPALSAANQRVQNDIAETVTLLQKTLSNDRDQLFKSFEQQRRQDEKRAEFRKEGNRITEPSLLPRFNSASKDNSQDKSWKEAVLKAARQEAAQQRDHNLTKDSDKAR